MGKGRALLKLTVNGTEHQVASDPETPLAYVLRDEMKLKGTKIGCGLEQCGACTVLADGDAVQSCATPVAVFEGKDIVTVEGIASLPEGRRVQQAFIAARAAQCGYCTAGLVVKVTELACKQADASPDALKTALNGHLCRCGAHPRVLAAAREAMEAKP